MRLRVERASATRRLVSPPPRLYMQSLRRKAAPGNASCTAPEDCRDHVDRRDEPKERTVQPGVCSAKPKLDSPPLRRVAPDYGSGLRPIVADGIRRRRGQSRVRIQEPISSGRVPALPQ